MKKITLLLSVALLVYSCGNKKGGHEGEHDTTGTVEATADPADINNPSTAADPAAVVDPTTAPQITFEQEQVNGGTITEGEQLEVVFKFTNTGKSNLIISGVEPTCGCTLAGENAYPKEPVAPGAEGKIRVVYNSEGRSTGNVSKTVKVKSNALAPNDVKEVAFTLDVTPKNK